MAVELERLMKKVSHMDISIVAGEKGIHNLVSWVHMVETKEASDFLEGGEIAFTTGLGLAKSTTMLALVENMYQKKAAGLVVNTGPFIEEVPQDVIEFGNSHDFPVFVVPWKIHLAEIMRVFCFAITKDDQKRLETSAAFKNALAFPTQEELYVIPLSQHGFRVHWQYAVCSVKILGIQSDVILRVEKIARAIDDYASHRYKHYDLFADNTHIIIIAANYTPEELRSFINDIQSYIKRILLPEETICIGCGRLTKSIRCLYKSYNQAKSIQKLQEYQKIDSSLIFYSDMGIYKLLLGITDHEIINEYCMQYILPLKEYDSHNNTDLINVLRSYLRHNGSVKEAADELYVHRNTVNYRLGKIEELLGLDLSSLDCRLQLTLALMLEDLH